MSDTSAPSPHQILRERHEENTQRAEELARQSLQLSVARGITLVVLVIVATVATETTWISAWWISIPALVMAVLIAVHSRTARAEKRAQGRGDFYRRALDRVEGRWIGGGVGGEQFRVADHPYAQDLDLFGPGSLFELLCTARTGSGQRILARWLLEAAPADEILRRHEALAELAPELELREEMALLGEESARAPDPQHLERWALEPATPVGVLRRGLAITLSLATTLCLVGWAVLGWGPVPTLLAGAALGAFARFHQNRTRRAVEGMRRPARELRVVVRLTRLIESRQVRAPELQRIRDELSAAHLTASVQIERLRRLGVLVDSTSHMLFAPFAALMLWNFHVAVAIERWRSTCGPRLESWFEALGRFEALNALAGFAWERPDASLPELVTGGPELFAEGLVHPLLPRAEAVANDLHLATAPAALIVSGSNMSGKSTLLRAVGANVVLAQAGAPVCARRLRLSPLAVGASIATLDSLLEGRSRFFAEISRMKQITELCAADSSVLFLLDEVFHGTNSHDRRLGAEQLLRFLVDQDAVGLITTHDLALAEIADTLEPRVANVHFRDALTEQGIVFDYRLHPGTVTTSNALRLMRQVGLPVAEED